MPAHRSLSPLAAVVALASLALASTGAHTIARGETLSRIAADHGTTVAALAQANGLENPDLIYAGTTLTIPAGGAEVAGPAVRTPALGAVAHVVRRGETITGIARRYDIPQAQLTSANGIIDGVIYTGQELRLVPVATDATRASLPIRCPVEGPVTFMNDWGFPRSDGRFHRGTDLFAPRGTPVLAAVAGRAVHTTGRLGGNGVTLYGSDGVTYHYNHLDSFGGSGSVSGGAVVGYVGSTGNAAGGAPHVHVEIHPGAGDAVNPYPSIAVAC